MNILLKRLNKEIIQWENLYGYWYTFLYDANGAQKKEQINNEYAYKCLQECRVVMNVLNHIKNNRNYEIKDLPKREYKINHKG